MFQFYNLIPSLTVRENVALVTDIVADAMPVDEAIDLVGLTPRRDHFPAAALGRRAAARRHRARDRQAAAVLLCDEPTGALDYQTGKLVLEVIARINRELGTTAIVITHNAAIAGMADRVVYLGDGSIQRIESQRAQARAVGAQLVKALDRKLLRDLRRMWSQALTIALVVASGVGGFVTSLSAVDSLALARDRFYADGRFADAVRRGQARAERARGYPARASTASPTCRRRSSRSCASRSPASRTRSSAS